MNSPLFLWYNNGCLTERHTEAAMCVKGWSQKLDITNFKTNSMPRFFLNIEKFYQSFNFGSFWWILFTVKPICGAYQNLCMNFTNILGFLPNFFTSWKSCAKEPWPKKSFFPKKTNFYMFPVFVEQIKSLCLVLLLNCIHCKFQSNDILWNN